MVTDKMINSQAFGIIFLPNEDYIESFIKDNEDLFEHF